jgi:hypothetical protein
VLVLLCFKLAFLSLMGSLLLPISLLLLAFLLLLGCHKLVSECMAHGHETATFLEIGRDDGHLAPLLGVIFAVDPIYLGH